MTLSDILKDSNYKLDQFSKEHIQAIEKNIYTKEVRGKIQPFVKCLVRNKDIQLKPEEVIRQLYIRKLNKDYLYPLERMRVEHGINHGRAVKRADIVVLDTSKHNVAYIIVEVKKPKLKDGKEQLKSYCNWSGAPMGVWTNGETISFYNRRDPNYFKDIPNAQQRLTDILTERWTINDLVKNDKLFSEKKTLKSKILELEDEVLANAGVDVFEELFQLIFTKLYDELESTRNPKRHLEFRNYGETDNELKVKIQTLFNKAMNKWEGVFQEKSKITLKASHLAICVASLEGIKLFNSNLDVVDEAFEYLINKSSKGEKGQYFTPRYVIDMCVKMLNPQEHETIIDTAAGSCGFPVHSIFYVWEQILKRHNLPKSHLFTAEKKLPEQEEYVQNKVFAIDFDERAVRVSRCLNLIAGDGQTNVLHLNTLDYNRWDDSYNNKEWSDIYNNGWKNLRKQLKHKRAKLVTVEEERNGKIYIKEKQIYDCRDFEFDVLMANPPFAGDIKEGQILGNYELAIKPNGKTQRKVGRDILFIERNLDFLKPGGRMAVVLPQGRFNNSSDKYIRNYIAERCRILAVVGLHGNVFKPHTGTKTSVLFVQKWDDKLCPKKEDYPIFFATMQESSKDNSGEKIYLKYDWWESKTITENKKKRILEKFEKDNITIGSDDKVHIPDDKKDDYLLDDHNHLIVKHDLFNHDGLLKTELQKLF